MTSTQVALHPPLDSRDPHKQRAFGIMEMIVRRRVLWMITDFLLFMMIIGPLIAPHFSRIESNLGFQPVAQFIFWIGHFICPQPQNAFDYAGMPFAVCYRCSMALLGLIIARVLHKPNGAMVNWTWRRRVLFIAVMLVWLQVDLQFSWHGIWVSNVPLQFVHGIPYGISVGGIWFGALWALDRWARNRSTQHRSTQDPSPQRQQA